MRGKSQFGNSILCIIVLTAAVALLVLLATVPAWAQNPVPPTAREAAALPEFAAKLHPATRPATNKPRASAHLRTGRDLPQGGVLYENGPVNGTTDAWTINFGFIVSDTFVPNSTTGVGGFDIYVWEIEGDRVTSVTWSITSEPNGGTVYGSGTVSGSNLTDTFISTNQYSYDIDKISATGLYVGVTSGQAYWVNLVNATTEEGEPVYWDENSGKGCHSNGCPSQAYENEEGTIPSESFDITGGGEPCFQSSGNMQIIHDFTGQRDGSNPSGVVADSAGNVYGSMNGLIYELAANQGWAFNPLYNSTGGTPTVGPGGVLYGTESGGIQNCGYNGTQSCGVVYSLRPGPSACLTALCPWTESVVYQPTGNNDAYDPGNLVFDQAGNLYGTSGSGGAYGKGAVFELTPSNRGWTEKILYSFTGGNDGGGPNSLEVGMDSNLYGTAGGGAYGDGVVFQLVRPPSAGNWTENVIYDFTGSINDFMNPYNLVQDGAGNLYGLAGAYSFLELFLLSPSNGSWKFSTIEVYAYPGYNAWSSTTLATDAAGDVYWANGYSWTCGLGSCLLPADGAEAGVRMWLPNGDYYQLYWVTDQIFFPSGSLGLDANRNVYGTTAGCGKYGLGTVWRLTN